ncbi:hypothetical protein [Gelidibacter japonicus]|uniref:hypothetical protein n=1 Tax=Gelidibacter japonicus TaxID=1962232 RepID=UPI003A8F69A2
MKWQKKGLIFKPSGDLVWSKTHAQVPVADFIEKENIIKVYFSTRDEYGRSMPGYIILDADNPKNIIEVGSKPILELGNLGTFDDCGVMPSWLVNHGDEKWLYYIGWNVRNTIPYHNAVGLAISKDDGKTFKKFSDGPLWERNYNEPHYSGTSCVLFDEGIWKNWYLSCTEWRIVDEKSEPRYHIKYAESKDGINWNRTGEIAIDYKDEDEAGIVKASVIIENGIYKMWYSYRLFHDYRTSPQSSYKIGYAESFDGKSWKRMDNNKEMSLSIAKNIEEWDGLMVAYPHVIDVKDKRLMFYNGNGFGVSGFGYAVLTESN